jgi:DNA (cytosine-5)-methyltransferase 1
MRTEHGNGNGHGKSLSIEAQRLLPTATTAQDAVSSSGSNPDWGHGVTLTDAARSMGPLMVAATYSGDFGPYAAAIERWEHTIDRPAPSPTEPGRDGRPRLSPAFVEWMMGLPAGWVTDTDIALRMLLGGDA